MNLHDLMHETTSQTHADVPRLIAIAQRDGARIRRRERAAISLVAIATASVVAGAVWLTMPGSGVVRPQVANDTSQVTPAPTPSVDSETPLTLSGRTAPIDGRGTVAALRWAVSEVADGTFSSYAGQGSHRATFGQLTFTPADGSGPGVVQVNVQGPYGPGFDCKEAYQRDCQLTTLGNGDILRTYWERYENVGALRVVADRLSADGKLRVVVRATNGNDIGGTAWEVTREGTVLNRDQLTAIVTQDWWGPRIPAEFVKQGADLAPYRDYDRLP